MSSGYLFESPVDPSYVPDEPPDLSGVHTVFLDTETTGLRWWADDRPVGISVNGKYLPFGHSGGNLDESTVKRWAERELRNKRIVNLNTRFDVHMMHAWGVDLEAQGCTVGDVGHYAALLDEYRRVFSLEVIAQDYLGEGKVEKDFDITRMAYHHASVVAEYAKKDTLLVERLLKKMQPLLDAEELNTVQALEDKLIFPTCEMERNGAPIDVDMLERWLTESDEKVQRTLWDIYRDTGMNVRPDSRKDMIKLFEHLGIEITHYTENYEPSFTDAVLSSYDNPVIKKVRQAGHLIDVRKYLVKYSEALHGGNILRYSLHQLRADDGGTVSGRYSSSGIKINGVSEGVNIQQVTTPEKQIAQGTEDFIIKKLFIPRKGRKWLAADAKQIEFRFFAHHSRSKKLLDAYAENPEVDFHNVVADIVRPFKPGLTRKPVKNLNFAKVYGGGKDKVAFMLGLPRSESDEFVAIYDRTFPEAGELLHRASRAARDKGYVFTLLGRRSRFPENKRLHKALNNVLQGSAADYMKLKIIELHETRRETDYKMFFTVHDESDGDVPDDESKRKVEEILNRQSADLRVPILWDVATGASWAECK